MERQSRGELFDHPSFSERNGQRDGRGIPIGMVDREWRTRCGGFRIVASDPKANADTPFHDHAHRVAGRAAYSVGLRSRADPAAPHGLPRLSGARLGPVDAAVQRAYAFPEDLSLRHIDGREQNWRRGGGRPELDADQAPKLTLESAATQGWLLDPPMIDHPGTRSIVKRAGA